MDFLGEWLVVNERNLEISDKEIELLEHIHLKYIFPNQSSNSVCPNYKSDPPIWIQTNSQACSFKKKNSIYFSLSNNRYVRLFIVNLKVLV